MKIKIHTLIVLFNLFVRGDSDFFTSVEHMKKLVQTQENTIKILEKYIKKETERTNIIEKHLTRFKTEHELAMKDVDHYLGNPMNSLMLIKRLTQDLPLIEFKIQYPTAFRQLMNLTYPKREDFVGAVKAVMRLQMTYQLNVTQLANGELVANFTEGYKVHKDVFTPSTASDCFEIGLGFYNDTEYKFGTVWFITAYEKFSLEDTEDHKFNETDIISYIYNGFTKLGDTGNMIVWLKKLLGIDPKNQQAPRWHQLLDNCKQRFAEEEQMRNERWWREVPWTVKSEHEADEIKADEKRFQLTPAQVDQKMFEMYCGVEEVLSIPTEINNKLKCFFQSGPHPFLHLARVMVEELYTNPKILIIRNLVTDHDIEELKNIARPRMKTPTKPGNIHYHSADVVISKSDWVTVNESKVVQTLQRRIAIVSGLDEGQEPLQVANYGISGHRFPHYDFLGLDYSDTTFFPVGGDRLATSFFYMSNVIQGGATVFPHLGVKVYPEKGAMLFWYNLHRSGEGDIATQHVECPVLAGNKWAAVLWKSQVGQELRRPCSKQHQELCDLQPYHYELPVMMHEQLCVVETNYIF